MRANMGTGYTNDDEIDLAWYFNESAGDLGMPSSFGAMVARLQMGRQVDTYATSEQAEDHVERRLDAARRYDRIGAALAKLSATKQKFLDEAFEHCECPRELVSRPRHHYKAARGSKAARAFLEALGSQGWSAKAAGEWLARAEHPQKGEVPAETLDGLRTEAWAQAESSYDSAVAEYAQAMRAVRHETEETRKAKLAKTMRGGR